MAFSAHAERTVLGVDELDGRFHDRTQRHLQIESRGDDEHRVEQTVGLNPRIGDATDTILHLGKQLPEPELR